MRLTPRQRNSILSAASDCFGADAQVILFGSRADDNARGGDIDLLVELPSGEREMKRGQIYF